MLHIEEFDSVKYVVAVHFFFCAISMPWAYNDRRQMSGCVYTPPFPVEGDLFSEH